MGRVCVGGGVLCAILDPSSRTSPLPLPSLTPPSFLLCPSPPLLESENKGTFWLHCNTCTSSLSGYSVVLCLYYTVLYCTVLYCTVLYCTCTVLYYTVLYCTVLYYTILYRCNILGIKKLFNAFCVRDYVNGMFMVFDGVLCCWREIASKILVK